MDDELNMKALREALEVLSKCKELLAKLDAEQPEQRRRVAHVWEGRPCCVNCNASAWDKDIPEFCKGAPAEPPKAQEQGVKGEN